MEGEVSGTLGYFVVEETCKWDMSLKPLRYFLLTGSGAWAASSTSNDVHSLLSRAAPLLS